MAARLRRHFHCKGKKRFATEECATVTRGHRVAKRGTSWAEVHAYRCRVCDWWHLGHRFNRDAKT